MMYANSKQQPLVEHCLQVERNAKLVFANMFSDFSSSNKSELESAISMAALLHDAGKVGEFQDYIVKDPNYSFEVGEGVLFSHENPLHHELSLLLLYALISDSLVQKYPCISISSKSKLLVKQLAAHACYWHHAEPIRESQMTTLLEDYFRDEKCLSQFVGQANELLSNLLDFDISLSHDDIFAAIDVVKAPEFIKASYRFSDGFNSWTRDFQSVLDFNVDCQVARFATIFADRHVSGLSADDMDCAIDLVSFDDHGLLSSIRQYAELSELKGFRTDAQVVAAKEFAESDITTIVGAAGAGKTRVALMAYQESRAFDSNHKGVLWVCPRIAVGLSVLDELKTSLPSSKISLFTGESKQAWQGNVQVEDLFGCDIVITTIDQVAKWMTKNGSSPMFAEFVNRFVVFDEYHELFSIKSLYYISAMLIRLKERQQKGHLLISATPDLVHLSLICRHQASVVMPIQLRSFNESPVCIDFVQDVSLDERGAAYIFNTATKAQMCAIDAWNERSDVMCYHSKFTSSDKQNLTQAVLIAFGRDSTDLSATLYAGPIAQASLNISRAKLVTEVTHPSNFIQRIGRCNRFNEYDSSAVIVLASDKQVKEVVAKYSVFGSVKNTGSRKSVYKSGRVTQHQFDNHYSTSSYNFFKALVVAFSDHDADGEVDVLSKLHGNKIQTNVNELNDFYLSYQMSELNDSSKLVLEAKDFVVDAIRYLEVVGLFKPVKVTVKTSDNAQAHVSFRGDSLWATMAEIKIDSTGTVVGELIGLPSFQNELVSLSESELFDVDVVSNLEKVKNPEFKPLKSSIKYRAKNSGNSKASHLLALAKNSLYPIVASVPSAGERSGVYYLNVENKEHGQLVIGFMNLAFGTKSIIKKLQKV